ncbi:ABC transporter ATP-binding protein [Nonomuraea sp. NPDC050663]|uniref:ABC transporter ATP-binding protein n=1 Tax=Nonomuraea sp. NPDC050663 TaxID=3364370 RepID=UPI0037A43E36
MKDLLMVYRHTFALAWRVAPVITVINLVMIVLISGSAALLASSQRLAIDAAGEGSPAGIWLAAALGVLAYAGTFTLMRIQGEIRQDLRVRVARELDHEVLALAAGIPTLEHLERPDFLDRVTNLRRGTWALASAVWFAAGMTGAAIALVGSLWLLAGVHPAMPVLACFAVPLFLLARKGNQTQRLLRDETAEPERHERQLHEMCLRPEPAKELRIAGSGPELSRRAGALWEETSRAWVRGRARVVAREAIGWTILLAGLGGALALALSMYAQGSAGLGDLVLIISLSAALSQQIQNIMQGYTMVADAGHVTGHYRWLKEYGAAFTTGGQAPPDRLAEGISLRDVSFTYPGTDTPVLSGIDLDLPAGSTVALVGINGAGKTTMIKLLTGMYRPDGGVISADGTPLAGLDARRWADRCAGVFQDFARLQLLVRENVGAGDLPRIDDHEAVAAAVERAGAQPLVDRLPGGLDTQLGTLFQGADLSFGQWQKLALARGMMRRKPLLLILDEPTSALDPQAEHELFEIFTAQARQAAREQGAVTVIVSHRFSTVTMADRIVVIEEGRIAEQGAHADLLASGGTYARLYTAQAQAYAGA